MEQEYDGEDDGLDEDGLVEEGEDLVVPVEDVLGHLIVDCLGVVDAEVGGHHVHAVKDIVGEDHDDVLDVGV